MFSHRSNRRLPLHPAVLAAAALAPAPAALADIYGHNNGPYDQEWGVSYMPDLDQKRSAAAGINGLPGDGTMYCCPTAVANIAGYTTWRGFGPWPASMNWSSSTPAIYNTATAHLAQLGQWMGTTADGGTSYPGSYNGALQLFDAAILFDVSYFKVNGSGNWAWSPRLEDLVGYGLSGGLVEFCFGRYDWHWDGGVVAEERTGGHCLTLTRGTINSGGNQIRFRNPSSNDSMTSQSAYATTTRACEDVFVDRMGTGVWMSAIAPSDGHTSEDETASLIDSTIIVWPTWGLIDPPPSGGQLVIDTAPIDFHPATDLAPIAPPVVPSMPGAPIDFTMRPDRRVIAYLFRPSPSQVALETRDTLSGVTSVRVTFNEAIGLVYNRFMELCVLTDHEVILYSTDAGRTTELARASLPAGAIPKAIEYNDTTDEVWVLDAAAHRMHRFDHRLVARRPLDLVPLVNGDPLVPATAAYSMTIDRRQGRVWIANELSGAVAHYVPAEGGRGLQAGQIISSPHPTDLQFDNHGRLLIGTEGGLFEFADTLGDGSVRPVPPMYSRLHPHRKFELTTSRTNEMTPASELPGWRDVPIEGEFDEGSVPDCAADVNGDGAVNVGDFLAFLRAYSTGGLSADFTRDGMVDVRDFLAFLGAYAAGCP